MEVRLFLNTLERQKKFNKIINGIFYQNYDIDLYVQDPNKSVDAKSMMAMWGFDLNHCVYAYINSHKPNVVQRFEDDMKEFFKE